MQARLASRVLGLQLCTTVPRFFPVFLVLLFCFVFVETGLLVLPDFFSPGVNSELDTLSVYFLFLSFSLLLSKLESLSPMNSPELIRE